MVLTPALPLRCSLQGPVRDAEDRSARERLLDDDLQPGVRLHVAACRRLVHEDDAALAQRRLRGGGGSIGGSLATRS